MSSIGLLMQEQKWTDCQDSHLKDAGAAIRVYIHARISARAILGMVSRAPQRPANLTLP